MNLKQLLASTEIAQLDDDELLMGHAELHGYYRELKDGREVKGWDMDSLIAAHEEIRQEIEDRGLPRKEINSLDNEAYVKQLEMELRPKYRWTPAHFSFALDVMQVVHEGLIEPVTCRLDQENGGLIILPGHTEDELSDRQVKAIEALIPVEVAGMQVPVHQVVDVEEYR